MATKNLTSGYTETDTSTVLTVDADKVTATTMDRADVAHVSKSYGTDYFDALNVYVRHNVTDTSAGTSDTMGGGFANGARARLADFASTDLAFPWAGGAGTSGIMYLVRGNAVAYDSYAGAGNTVYYCHIERAAGNNTATVKVYSDEARTDLLDTLSVSGYSTVKWSHHLAWYHNYDGSSSTHTLSGYIGYWDFNDSSVQDAAATETVTFTDSGTAYSTDRRAAATETVTFTDTAAAVGLGSPTYYDLELLATYQEVAATETITFTDTAYANTASGPWSYDLELYADFADAAATETITFSTVGNVANGPWSYDLDLISDIRSVSAFETISFTDTSDADNWKRIAVLSATAVSYEDRSGVYNLTYEYRIAPYYGTVTGTWETSNSVVFPQSTTAAGTETITFTDSAAALVRFKDAAGSETVSFSDSGSAYSGDVRGAATETVSFAIAADGYNPQAQIYVPVGAVETIEFGARLEALALLWTPAYPSASSWTTSGPGSATWTTVSPGSGTWTEDTVDRQV